MKYLNASIEPIGSYTAAPWPLGAESDHGQAQGAGNGAGSGGEWWRTWTTPEAAGASTNMLTSLINAIKGTPAGYGTPGYVEPTTSSPVTTILLIAGVGLLGYFVYKAATKKKAPVRTNRGRRRKGRFGRKGRSVLKPNARRNLRRFRR